MLPATQVILAWEVLLHKDGKLKSIQHLSRTLLPAEMNLFRWEGLAIIFALKKFHKYVHGREFILQTDHRPLLAIFAEPLTKMGYDAS